MSICKTCRNYDVCKLDIKDRVYCCSFVYPKEELKEQEIRNKAIDEFAKRLKNHLNEFDFWKYGISDGTNYETRNYDHMIDKIAEQMKKEV